MQKKCDHFSNGKTFASYYNMLFQAKIRINQCSLVSIGAQNHLPIQKV